MTLAGAVPTKLIRIDLEFLKPFAATSIAEFTFKPEGNQTAVTWSMAGKVNFVAKVNPPVRGHGQDDRHQFRKGTGRHEIGGGRPEEPVTMTDCRKRGSLACTTSWPATSSAATCPYRHAVSRRGEVHVDAIGTKAVAGGDPIRRDTIFRIASLTKPIAAAATMILVRNAGCGWTSRWIGCCPSWPIARC